jgi:hypothetical protein
MSTPHGQSADPTQQQAPYGSQPQHEQPQYSQPQYNQPQYDQGRPSQPQYAQPQYDQAQYGQAQYGQPQHAQAPTHAAPQQPYATPTATPTHAASQWAAATGPAFKKVQAIVLIPLSLILCGFFFGLPAAGLAVAALVNGQKNTALANKLVLFGWIAFAVGLVIAFAIGFAGGFLEAVSGS